MNKKVLRIHYVDKKTGDVFHLPVATFKKPSTAAEYAELEKLLDELIDVVRGQGKHPLSMVMQIIGENLEQYDNAHFPDIGANINEIDFVKFLMTSHGYHQSDLADIFGGQANVSKYLKGERPLSKKQIIGLKKKFNISADFFISAN
jgi:HTH-type transcriptional regulator/antitoxin HigA